MNYRRFADRCERLENWLFDQPVLIGLPIMLAGILAVVVILIESIVFALGPIGPFCAPHTVVAVIESHEMVPAGKITLPGIVHRKVCVPE